MYLLPFLARHGPGATGAQCTLDGLLAGGPAIYYTANSYITPGPGAVSADCGRDRSRPPRLFTSSLGLALQLHFLLASLLLLISRPRSCSVGRLRLV
jgi:hypothetical protein